MIPLALSPEEIVVDSFAGGGGASLGIEQALGRPVDAAINHDAEAVALHAALDACEPDLDAFIAGSVGEEDRPAVVALTTDSDLGKAAARARAIGSDF